MSIKTPWIKTAAEWTAQDPYLPLDVQCIESDTGKSKLGLGNRWSVTSYEPTVDTIAEVTGLQDALDGKVTSDTTVAAISALTASEYSAMDPKLASVLYIITDASAGATGVYLGSTAIASKAV